METQPITSTASQAAATAAAAAEQDDAVAAAAISSDFTTFLQLLTAQLKNQDPLNPMDGAEFVAQLAQFSAVEQQVRGNDTLARIETALIGGAGLTEWLGVEVETSAALQYQGSPLDLRYDANPEAAQATLFIKNQSGVILAAQPLVTGVPDIAWDGELGANPAPIGAYTFEVEQVTADGERTRADVTGYAVVKEARIGADGVDLVLEGGDVIPSSEVKAARNPAGA